MEFGNMMWVAIIVLVLGVVFYSPLKTMVESKFGKSNVAAVDSAVKSTASAVQKHVDSAMADLKSHVSSVTKHQTVALADHVTSAVEAATATSPTEVAQVAMAASVAPATTIAEKRKQVADQIAALQKQDADLQQLDDTVKKALA